MKRSQRQKKNIHVFRNPNHMNNNCIVAPNPPEPNKGFCLNTANTDDEKFVRNSLYKFNKPIDKLINDSETSRFATLNKRNGERKVPRRQNAWIIYRRDKSLSPEFSGKPSQDISKEISKMWEKESKETKELFEALARLAGKKHSEKHGEDYKYNPKDPKRFQRNEQIINEEFQTPAPSSFEERRNFFTPPISPITSIYPPSSDSTASPEQPLLPFSTNIYFSYYMN
ncbi:hypothetical protein RclHR1_00570011 [Rhizophagus clarus]|uniref:High mobility group box domain-containing protein n=1 Tax=Rhizophagus clarus TaxID=94130 RepID=A0A2Z6S113_9GLOM|nr:hypothetical protein RclHR1_00570011 [Rhizophagus clarus]GET04223.1 high mobility group box domain-containing protein [Rhizophagus clarus]